MSDLLIRRATTSDRDAVIALCRDSLGWQPSDPNEEFYSWKHDDNPFGTSPTWLALQPDGRVVGLRAFLRWEFHDHDGSTIRAVRAVDTATHPDVQGQGVFTKLTTGAIPDLQDDDVGCIFNTPNEKSRPGYLRMGWSDVGRVPVSASVRSPKAALRLRGARAAADLWGADSTCGIAAPEFLSDTSVAAELARHSTGQAGIRTRVSPEFLAWRYRFAPLHYRVFPLGDTGSDGAIVFRVRRRGTATEVAICRVLAPPQARLRQAIRRILVETGADYAMGTTNSLPLSSGCIPVPRSGPILTWRAITRPGVPEVNGLGLNLGDLELF